MWPFSRPAPSGPPVAVTIYTKRDCPLCDEAKEVLAAAGRRHALEVAWVDIAGDPELEALYGLEVPVVFVAGRKRFFGHVSPALLEKAIVAARGSA